MFTFLQPNTSIALVEDVLAIKKLVNSAYRGEDSKKGWTTEADLIEGNIRATEAEIIKIIQPANSIIIKYTNQANEIVGCVNVQQHQHKMYVGMFSVQPQLQGKGIGKNLLSAAEEYAAHLQCNTLYMTVISVRTTLIDWYKRHGYIDTNERKPFVEDGISGKHKQALEFMVLEKKLLLG